MEHIKYFYASTIIVVKNYEKLAAILFLSKKLAREKRREEVKRMKFEKCNYRKKYEKESNRRLT